MKVKLLKKVRTRFLIKWTINNRYKTLYLTVSDHQEKEVRHFISVKEFIDFISWKMFGFNFSFKRDDKIRKRKERKEYYKSLKIT